jgi:hypothetical protein
MTGSNNIVLKCAIILESNTDLILRTLSLDAVYSLQNKIKVTVFTDLTLYLYIFYSTFL